MNFVAPPGTLALGNFDVNVAEYVSAVKARVPDVRVYRNCRQRSTRLVVRKDARAVRPASAPGRNCKDFPSVAAGPQRSCVGPLRAGRADGADGRRPVFPFCSLASPALPWSRLFRLQVRT